MSVTSTSRRIGESVHQMSDSSKEFVSDHPMSTTLAAFGLGLGLGVAAVYLFSEGGACQRHDSALAHNLGRRMLDKIGNVLPDSLTHFGR